MRRSLFELLNPLGKDAEADVIFLVQKVVGIIINLKPEVLSEKNRTFRLISHGRSASFS